MRLEAIPPADLLTAIRAPLEAKGQERINPPILLPLNLLLDLTGEDLRTRLFIVQGDSGEELAMRPDLTLAIARMHVESGRASGHYLYEGRAFRAAPATSREPTEFLQVGVEHYGAPVDLAAEAGLIASTWQSARAGGRLDLRLTLGDVGLFGAFIDSLRLPRARADQLMRLHHNPARLGDLLSSQTTPETDTDQALARTLSTLPPTEAARVLAEVWRLAGIEPVGGRTAEDVVERLIARAQIQSTAPLTAEQTDAVKTFLTLEGAFTEVRTRILALAGPDRAALEQGLGSWADRITALDDAGVPAASVGFTTRPGRGFGYYDGLMFKIVSDALGSQKPVGAGGRYGSLISRLGGPATTALGSMVQPGLAWSGSTDWTA